MPEIKSLEQYRKGWKHFQYVSAKRSPCLVRAYFWQKDLKDVHQALEQLKTMMDSVRATTAWSQEQQYAILESFASLNELLARRHWDGATRNVARSLRNTIFKDHEQVLKLVGNKGNLLGIINNWITFLETEIPGYLRDEQAVLTRVNSHTLEAMYVLGQSLPQHRDVEKTGVLLLRW